MMSKALAGWQCQKGNGSNAHTRHTGFFLVRLLTDEVPRVKILILLKYLKRSNDSKAENQLSSVNDPFSSLFLQTFIHFIKIKIVLHSKLLKQINLAG